MKQNKTFVVVAAMVAVFLGWIAIAGNHLPAPLRDEIQTEQKRLNDAKTTLARDQRTVLGQIAAEPTLFQVRSFDQTSKSRFDEAAAALNEADRFDSQLQELRRKNSRSSKDQVEDLLRRERERRAAALSEADAVVRDAQARMDLKQNFPATLRKISAGAAALETADYAPVVSQVNKAEQDWPSKKDELQGKLTTLTAPKAEAVKWVETTKELAAKPVADLTSGDYAQAIEIEEAVAHAPGPAQAAELAGLSRQLYTSWDNVLTDLDKSHDEYRERIKHVVTTVPAPTAKGTTSGDEQWKNISANQWRALEGDIGMSIAHKPLGKFDAEADNTPQPPGFAYMVSPEVGRNQYGYWDHRAGGSVWTWLPEYLILRDLLSNRSYMPVPSYDWDRYRQAQRYGKTYYGYDTGGAPKYGSHGTFTQQRYANSRYVQTGGFSGSKYSSSGGFSGSKYGSGSTPRAGSSSGYSGSRFGSGPTAGGPKRFGSSSSGSGGMRFGSGSRSSGGRSFGGGGRRR